MNIYRSILSGLALLFMGSSASAAEPMVVVLTQVPCQFLESEADQSFSSTSAADCVTLNKETAEQRLAESEPLQLKPGSYIFRVTNKNVPYDLGFWLRGEGLVGRATLPSVSGGGLVTGKTLDYKIDLKAGEYLFSCPLNPTPDYRLIVRE